MTNKPQRFKILRNADPEALAREVSEHMNGVDFVDSGVKKTFYYGLHGETRVVENNDGCFPVDDVANRWYEQNVQLVDRVEVEPAASEAIQ